MAAVGAGDIELEVEIDSHEALALIEVSKGEGKFSRAAELAYAVHFVVSHLCENNANR